MELSHTYLKAASTDDHLRNIDKFCRKAPPGDFMECGVLRGGTAAVLIDAAGPKRKVWLCDTFGQFPLKGIKDVGELPQPSVGYTIPKVTAYLERFGASLDNVVFVRGFFKDTLPEVMKKIKRLALVNFDGDWHDSVMGAFPHILKKLCPGGILLIHDYPLFKGLVEAVHKFIDPKELHLFTERGKQENAYYIKGAD